MCLSLSDKILEFIFQSIVKVVSFLFSTIGLNENHERLRGLSKGSVGKSVADCLDLHGYSFVPGFVSHDLKHVLLEYDMTPIGETRLQAFMLGNGNWSLPTLFFFLIGFVFKPFQTKVFWRDFINGYGYPSIKDITLNQVENVQLSHLQKELAEASVSVDSSVSRKLLMLFFSSLVVSLSLVLIGLDAPIEFSVTTLMIGIFGLSSSKKTNVLPVLSPSL